MSDSRSIVNFLLSSNREICLSPDEEEALKILEAEQKDFLQKVQSTEPSQKTTEQSKFDLLEAIRKYNRENNLSNADAITEPTLSDKDEMSDIEEEFYCDESLN